MTPQIDSPRLMIVLRKASLEFHAETSAATMIPTTAPILAAIAMNDPIAAETPPNVRPSVPAVEMTDRMLPTTSAMVLMIEITTPISAPAAPMIARMVAASSGFSATQSAIAETICCTYGARSSIAPTRTSPMTGAMALMMPIRSWTIGPIAWKAVPSTGPMTAARSPMVDMTAPIVSPMPGIAALSVSAPPSSPSKKSSSPPWKAGCWKTVAIASRPSETSCPASTMTWPMVGAMLMNASPRAETPGPRARIAWFAARKMVVSAPCHTRPCSASLTRPRPSARSPRPGPPARLAALCRDVRMPKVLPTTRPRSLSAWMPVSIHTNICPDSTLELTQFSKDSATPLNAVASAGMYDMPTVPSWMMALVSGSMPLAAMPIASERKPKLAPRRSMFLGRARVSAMMEKKLPRDVAVFPRPSSSMGRAVRARFRIGASALAQKLLLMMV